MSNRQIVVAALVLGLTAALVVWWLESFNRERLKADWRSFIEEWPNLAHGEATA